MPSNKSSYLQRLKEKKSKLTKDIFAIEQELYGNVNTSDEYFELRDKLNAYKLDLMTVKSRLTNYNNKSCGLMNSVRINEQSKRQR